MDSLPFRNPDEVERSMPRVLAHLRANGVIAYPTETVYGFGCLLQPAALAELRALKRRGVKPFLLLVAEQSDVADLAWTPAARRLAAEFWPGPLTLALAAGRGTFPDEVRGDGGTVAVRATSHPGIRLLVQALGAPITSTSANAPGESAARDAREAARALASLGTSDVLILDGGRLASAPPSTVVDVSRTPPRVLRAGAVALDALRTVIGDIDAG